MDWCSRYLFEIVAGAIHQVAVKAFRLRLQRHETDTITSWTAPKENALWWRHNPNGAPQTLLYHTQYSEYDRYPNSVADGVGYWAQSRILGGVFLRESNPVYPKMCNVYLHPDGSGGNTKIFGPSQGQLNHLKHFLHGRKSILVNHSLPKIIKDDPMTYFDLSAELSHREASDRPRPSPEGTYRPLRNNTQAGSLRAAEPVPASEKPIPQLRLVSVESGIAKICPMPFLRSKDQPARTNPLRSISFTSIYGEHWVANPGCEGSNVLKDGKFFYDISHFVTLEEFFLHCSQPVTLFQPNTLFQ